MELLIFSDSHGNIHAMQNALARQIKSPDAICFLGDGLSDIEKLDAPRSLLYTVRGNCDWGRLGDGYPTERQIELEGHKLLLTHGHLYSVKSGCGALLSYAARIGADIVLFGHTHTPVSLMLPAGETVGECCLSRPLYLFNPGSIGSTYEGGSFGTLTLRKETVLLSHGKI